jgi:uncharacterized membrane protein
VKTVINKYLVAGLLVVIPVVATVWVLKVLILWLDGIIFSLLPAQLSPQYLFGYHIPGIGLLLTFVIILLTGVLTRLYIGKKLVGLGDRIFARLPFGRAIYKATQQVLSSTLAHRAQKEKRVVLVEYPKQGSYCIAFMTGTWSESPARDGKRHVTVFMPTAPNPTSGFLMIVPETAIVPTGMTAEEATKLIVSGGLLAKKTEVA